MMGAALSVAAGAAFAQDDEVTLQLKWVTQAQFAGYYVAQDRGFYEEEGLDVTIKPGGPDIAPTQVLAGGGADVIVEWMPAALAARERGLPLVNIAQPFKSSGMMLTCWKDAGIESPDDLDNRTLGVWFFGNEYPFLSWMSQLGIETDGAEEGSVEVLKQGFNVDPLLQRQADCISTMTYNEYWQVEPDRLKATLVEADARRFIVNMPRLLRGRPNPAMTPGEGYHSGSVERLCAQFTGSYTLDGEIFSCVGGQLIVEPTQAVGFLPL